MLRLQAAETTVTLEQTKFIGQVWERGLADHAPDLGSRPGSSL